MHYACPWQYFTRFDTRILLILIILFILSFIRFIIVKLSVRVVAISTNIGRLFTYYPALNYYITFTYRN